MAARKEVKPPPRLQCAKCPWKKGVDPHDIPNGYEEKKHCDLKDTIAEPGTFRPGVRRMTACHETDIGEEKPCVGWLIHQLNEGNNIGLRMAVMHGVVDANVRTVGPQHLRFEDTLPKKKKKKT
jgi:Family of unknown function (DUF6283)